MFFARSRRFVMFIDPFTLSDRFTEAKTLPSLFEIWHRQSKVFSLRDHGFAFIRSMQRFSKSELETGFLDVRFRNFLKTLESEPSTETFLTTTYELAELHQNVGVELHPDIVSKFSELLTGFNHWSLSEKCKGLQVFSIISKKSGKDTLCMMIDGILENIEKSLPKYDDLMRVIKAFRNLKEKLQGVKEKTDELLYVFEPYLLRDMPIMENQEVIEVYEVYSCLNQGTKDFINHTMMKLLIISSDLSSSQLSSIVYHSCEHNSQKLLNFQESMMLLLNDIMKKMQTFSSNDLFPVLKSLFSLREGNVHFYEILSIAFVKHAKTLNDQNLIDSAFILALTGVKSLASAKVLNSILKPMVLSQASTIQGHLSIEKVSPVGLLSHADYEDFQIDQVKHMLFPQIKQEAKKARPVKIKEVLKITSHPFYDFTQMIKLLWSFLVIAHNSSIEIVDGTILNLMIRLVERQLFELNQGGGTLIQREHDMVLQVREFIAKYFLSIKNLEVPRPLHDFSLHSKNNFQWFLSEEEKTADKEFLENLERFCNEKFYKVEGLKAFYEVDRKYDPYYLVNGFFVHIPGKVPALVIRNSDCFRNGELTQITKLKIKSLGKVKVLKSCDWEKIRSDSYFEDLLETPIV